MKWDNNELNPVKDFGGDSEHNIFQEDAMAYRIDYFNEDYKPIHTDTVSFLKEYTLSKSLYNGNIVSATNDLLPFKNSEDPLGRTYHYDQLNRLLKADYAWVDSVGGFKGN